MRAILFDIDGTLVQTGAADGACFAEAYRAVFSQAPASVSWDDYAHVTDWGILDEALGAARNRSSTLAERTAFERAYRDAWQQQYAFDPSSCTEVPGAAALIAWRLCPLAASYFIAAHRSVEPGHGVGLEAMGLSPLLDLEMRLGEGTGAALAIPLVEAAAKCLAEMATFTQAGVSERDEDGDVREAEHLDSSVVGLRSTDKGAR